MADIGQKDWLVSPNKIVEDMWLKVRIQEKKSQLAGYKRNLQECEQKIEDLKEGMMVDLQARVIMIEKEIAFMETMNIKQKEEVS